MVCPPILAADDPPEIVIGLIDTFSPDFYIHTYSPTIDHLMRQIPNRKFRFVELDYRNVKEQIRALHPDFLVTSASTYVDLIDSVGALQIASRARKGLVTPSQSVGSVFIVRNDSPIQNIAQMKGKKVAITAQTSFDGWLIALGEVANETSNPRNFFSSILETQYEIPDVASLVQMGLADVGVLPNCELETLVSQQRLRRDELRVLQPKNGPGECLRSTSLYPDVIFSSLPQADVSTVENVLIFV